MTRTKVVIINGVAQSGKDTFVKFATDYCNLNEYANVLNISSVDPIKDMLTSFGWNGDKTTDVRDIIAGIKKIWISAQNGPTMFMINNIMNYHMIHSDEDNIIFCHIREVEEIEKLEKAISGMESIGISVSSILLKRDIETDDRRPQDKADIISKYAYNIEINNKGALEQLEKIACEFIDMILSEWEREYK